MFKLINEKKEKHIKKHSSISFIIKKNWKSATLINHLAIPYNVFLFSDGIENNLHLYTCYIDIYKDTLEVNNLIYAEENKSALYFKQDLAYLYLTMTIEQAMKLTKIKYKHKLIFSSYINNSFEILLDYNFQNLENNNKTNYQKGMKLLTDKKE